MSERTYRATLAEKQQWADLYEYGYTIEWISLEYSRGINTVRNGLLKLGVAMRGPGTRRSASNRAENAAPAVRPVKSPGTVHRAALNMRHHRRRGMRP